MDELAYKLNMDPLQLHIINHSDKNEHSNSNKND
jgi:CO/xanthine dehydrogenase Mo-binding subunit